MGARSPPTTRNPAAATWRRGDISSNGGAIRALADAFAGEDEILGRARERAREVGVVPVTPGCGSALSLIAAAVDARAVAEIGTGTGVSGLYLLRGMRADGVLTTVDADPENQRLAREAFTAGGFAGGRARFIPGPALEVLPRLADGGYDLVFCDGDRAEHPACLDEALRLLRPGGAVIFAGTPGPDRAAGPALDAETAAVREVLVRVREHPGLVPALLPAGDGLLCAVRR